MCWLHQELGRTCVSRVSGIDGVLQAYANCIRNVQLYGPTNVAPLIRHVSRFALTAQREEPQKGAGVGFLWSFSLLCLEFYLSEWVIMEFNVATRIFHPFATIGFYLTSVLTFHLLVCLRLLFLVIIDIVVVRNYTLSPSWLFLISLCLLYLGGNCW